jgi:uncharacterized damage-inducible protein DinB
VEDPLGVRRDERATLEGALDWYRAVVERKVDGLNRTQAQAHMTPSRLSILGVINHLGHVERAWFRGIFAGEDLEKVGSEGDNSAEFEVLDDDTIQSVVAFYRDGVARSREITRNASLDDLSARPSRFGERVSLRWILVHMLEETARHAGHMDVMREEIDGLTGD